MYSPHIKRVVYTDRINFITFSFHFLNNLQVITYYCHIVCLEKISLLCPEFPVDLKATTTMYIWILPSAIVIAEDLKEEFTFISYEN